MLVVMYFKYIEGLLVIEVFNSIPKLLQLAVLTKTSRSHPNLIPIVRVQRLLITQVTLATFYSSIKSFYCVKIVFETSNRNNGCSKIG